MIKSVTKNTVFFLSIVFSSLVLASTETDLNQLKKYLLEKKINQAYEYSKSLAEELSGELEFDFLAGLAAYGVGKHHEAVFAFERVVMLDPGSFNGRYYLALSYQKVHNLHGAVFEFDKLLENSSIANPLTQQQKDKVEIQLDAIKKQIVDIKHRWSHDIWLGIGSDNNINSGSSQDAITLPDGTLIPLFDSSKDTADSSYSSGYHVNYQHSLSQYKRWVVDLFVQSKNYFSYTEYNRQMLTLSLKFEHQLSDDSSWYLGATTSPLWFSNEKYRTQNAINFGWNKPINTQSDYGFNGSIADVDHFVYDELDLERYQLNAFYRFRSKYQHMIFLNWYQDENKKGVEHNNRTSMGASYVISYSIYSHLTGNSMIAYEKQDYEQPNPLFDAFSDSSLAIISTELIYKYFDKQILQLKLSYQDKHIDSKVSAMKIYEYDRLEVNFTWRYAF